VQAGVAVLDHLMELFLLVLINIVAVLVDKIVHSQVSSTHSNHNLVFVKFDKNPPPVVTVNTLAFPL